MRFRGDIVRRNSSSSFSNNSIVGDAGGKGRKKGKKEGSKLHSAARHDDFNKTKPVLFLEI